MLKNFAPQQKVMKNGILFIWTEKEDIQKMIEIMESVGFAYIENFCLVQLDSSLIFSQAQSLSFPKSKTTLDNLFSQKTTGDSSPTEGEPLKQSLLDLLKNSRSSLGSLEVQSAFLRNRASHFLKTKKTLLMFRIVRKYI